MANLQIRMTPEQYAQIEKAAESEDMKVGTFARRQLLLLSTRSGIAALYTQTRIWFLDATLQDLEDQKAEAERKLTRTRARLNGKLSASARSYYAEEARDYETTIALRQARIDQLLAEKAAILTTNSHE